MTTANATKPMTKLDMARMIVKQLYVMDELPAPDHHHVKKLMRKNATALKNLTELAKRAAESMPEDDVRRPITIPTKPSIYKEDVGHFTSSAIIRVSGQRNWHTCSVGGWTEKGEGRIVHGGPKVKGPHAYLFGNGICMTNNPKVSGTSADIRRAKDANRYYDLSPGDIVRLEGTEYCVGINRNGFPALAKVEA